MMPADKRGSYSAFFNLSFSGADFIARSTIILGAFLIPTMMSVYIGILLMIGIFLSILGYSFVKRRTANIKSFCVTENRNDKWGKNSNTRSKRSTTTQDSSYGNLSTKVKHQASRKQKVHATHSMC